MDQSVSDFIFKNHPDPLWIYDIETLAFLDVNCAAENVYGWSRDQFLSLTLADIPPPEDVDRMRKHVAAQRDGADSAGVWRHRTRTGKDIFVDVVSQSIEHRGRNARLEAMRDVSRLVAAERDRTAVLESIGDGFFTLDSDYRFSYINAQAERYLGKSRAELVGRTIWDVLPKSNHSLYIEVLEAAKRNNETQRLTDYIEENQRWYNSRIYPSNSGFTVIVRDATKERNASRQIRLLEHAIAQLNDAVLITKARPIDAKSGGPEVVYVNDAFTRMTGFSKDEILGKTPRLLQGEATDRGELDRIREALEAWQSVRAELVNYTKSGEPFCVEMDIVPFAAEAGPFTHLVAVQRDVSERQAAAKSLRESEERFQLLARATNDVIWDWRIDTNDLWWNANLHEVFGYRSGLNQSPFGYWFGRIHSEERDRVRASFDAALQSEATVWEEQYRVFRANNETAYVIDRGFITRDSDGNAMRMVGSIRDITEQREFEEQSRQSQKLETIGQLTGGVAHDFNNLLTIIMTNAEGLEEALGSRPELQELAQMTVRAAERGAELTNRLLAVARRQPLTPLCLNIGELINDLKPLLRRTLAGDIDLEVEIADEGWAVELDAGQFEVALLNLTINARDAMPDGGKLRISVDKARKGQCPPTGEPPASRPCVCISVSDVGHGMPEAVRRRALEPFFTTKPTGKGSGLGLAMVYGFVKQSGGDLVIRSHPDDGTRVEMFFPRASETTVFPIRRQEAAASGGEEHIMVVEDDPHVRRNVVRQLEALGYRVTQAENAEKALKGMPDDVSLLLTDIVMPGKLNGHDLAAEASKTRPDLRILFTSGYSEDTLLKEGRIPPNVQLLSKPYRRRELAAKVRELLDAPRRTIP